jgi:hypothetical protein
MLTESENTTKEIKMKKLMLVVLISVMSVVFLQAQNLEKRKFLKAEKGYLEALSFDNEGVVEDAIFCVLIMYARYPDNDYSKMEKQLQELAFNASQPMIRLKAYMAYQSLHSNNWFEDAKLAMQEHDPNKMFAVLSECFLKNTAVVAVQ